jgi:thioredoxin 1
MRVLTVLLLGVSVLGLGAAEDNNRFEPLENWKAAVMAGDAAGLRAFYRSGSGAFAQTPEGKSESPEISEPQFWSKLASQGLVEMNAKILSEESTALDMKQFVLRIEMTFQTAAGKQKSLVSGVQIWVRNGEWRIFATRRSGLRPLPAIRLPQPQAPNPNLYPAPEDAAVELKEALASAKVDHKRVLIVFGANWCYDCHVLDATLRSAAVAPLVTANYHVLHINIGDDGDSNGDLAERFQVPLKKGIPSLAVLDGDGNLITSQKNGEFESAAKIGLADVTAFLERWKPGTGK